MEKSLINNNLESSLPVRLISNDWEQIYFPFSKVNIFMVLSYEEDIMLFSLHSKTFKTFSEWSVIACNNSYSFFPFNLITFIV